MTTLVRAIYNRGVLKLKDPLPLLNAEQVSVLVTPVGQWERAFRTLLAAVHARSRRFTSKEIERDITSASRQARKRPMA